MSTEDELWRARFNVKRAVLDCVAHDYHDEATASNVFHGDYLEDMLDEALKEYVKAYLVSGETPRELTSHIPSAEDVSQILDDFFNRRAD